MDGPFGLVTRIGWEAREKNTLQKVWAIEMVSSRVDGLFDLVSRM